MAMFENINFYLKITWILLDLPVINYWIFRFHILFYLNLN
jgi:hypothetical protein